MRLVSLVPSLTELLFWLGAGQAVVGRTRFCTEPAGLVESVEAVGGTKNPDVDRIAALGPDIVIANREENRREDVETLAARGLRVLVTDIVDLESAERVVLELGELVGQLRRAQELVEQIEEARAGARPTGARVFVPVWRRPLLGLGRDTFGHAMIAAGGGTNVLAARARYPAVTLEEVRTLAPTLILLPDEPYRSGPQHIPEFESVAPAQVVDGKLLWWYGPRTPSAIRTLQALFQRLG